MPATLSVLVWTVAWFIALVFVPSTARTALLGTRWGLGNRDTSPPVPPWVSRAERARNNMLENLVPFATLVLVANVAGLANETTAACAVTFLGARIAHGLAYIAGIIYVRTLAFAVGLAAEISILLQLL